MRSLVMRMKFVHYTVCSLVLVGLLACNQQSQNAVETTVTPEVKTPVVKEPAKTNTPTKKTPSPVKPQPSKAPVTPVRPVEPVVPVSPVPEKPEVTVAPEVPAVANPTRLKPLGKRVCQVPMKGKYVALTFDDGPHSSLTPKALDILKKHGAKGTFFMLGQNAARNKTIVARAAAEGHELGVHTWSHIKMNSSAMARVDSEVSRTQNVIAEASGVVPRVMRPPYGATNAKLINHMHDRYGMASILWDVDTLDWRKPGVDKVISTAVNKAKPGSIILVHDIHASTLSALEGIVTGLQARGFQLVTVSELMLIGKREAAAPSHTEPAPVVSPDVEPVQEPVEQPIPELVTPEQETVVSQPQPVEEIVNPAAETPSMPLPESSVDTPIGENDLHAASDNEAPLNLETLDF